MWDTLGGWAELLSGLSPVDVEMTESVASGAVDGDVVAVEEHSDLSAGVGSADRDHGWTAESDVAVAEDGEDLDLGVALHGELAWPAEGGCVVPGLFVVVCSRRCADGRCCTRPASCHIPLVARPGWPAAPAGRAARL